VKEGLARGAEAGKAAAGKAKESFKETGKSTDTPVDDMTVQVI